MITLHASRRESPLRSVDFSAILAVYKSREGFWKGFAHPYDVIVNGRTKLVTLRKLREAVLVYESRLHELDWPDHLVHQSLTDLEDREVLSKLIFKSIDTKRKLDENGLYAEARDEIRN